MRPGGILINVGMNAIPMRNVYIIPIYSDVRRKFNRARFWQLEQRKRIEAPFLRRNLHIFSGMSGTSYFKRNKFDIVFNRMVMDEK